MCVRGSLELWCLLCTLGIKNKSLGAGETVQLVGALAARSPGGPEFCSQHWCRWLTATGTFLSVLPSALSWLLKAPSPRAAVHTCAFCGHSCCSRWALLTAGILQTHPSFELTWRLLLWAERDPVSHRPLSELDDQRRPLWPTEANCDLVSWPRGLAHPVLLSLQGFMAGMREKNPQDL